MQTSDWTALSLKGSIIGDSSGSVTLWLGSTFLLHVHVQPILTLKVVSKRVPAYFLCIACLPFLSARPWQAIPLSGHRSEHMDGWTDLSTSRYPVRAITQSGLRSRYWLSTRTSLNWALHQSPGHRLSKLPRLWNVLAGLLSLGKDQSHPKKQEIPILTSQWFRFTPKKEMIFLTSQQLMWNAVKRGEVSFGCEGPARRA